MLEVRDTTMNKVELKLQQLQSHNQYSVKVPDGDQKTTHTHNKKTEMIYHNLG